MVRIPGTRNNLFDKFFIRYAIIGMTGVAIDFIVYALLVWAGVSPLLATSVSISLAILNNYVLNIKFNFKVKSHLFRRLSLFYVVGLVGLLISVALIFVLNTIFGVDAVVSKLITIPPVVLMQYWLNKNMSLTDDLNKIPKLKIAILFGVIFILAMFGAGSVAQSSQDESDNILGAHLVAEGSVIYRDYFSHHMPLLYYVGAPIAYLTGENILAFKVAYALLAGTWLLLIAYQISKLFGVRTAMLFAGLIAVAQVPMGYNGYLAESVIAFAVVNVVVLLLRSYREQGSISKKRIVVTAVLSVLPFLASASYAPLSIVLFVALLLMVAVDKKAIVEKIKNTIVAVVAFAMPMVLLSVHFVQNHAVTEFIQQAFQFNTKYYSQFEQDAPIGLIDSGLQVINGSMTGLSRALIGNGDFLTHPVTTLFAVAIICTLCVMYRHYSRLVAVMTGVVVILTSVRGGFYAILTVAPFPALATRSGMSLYFLGVLLFSWLVFDSSIRKKKDILSRTSVSMVLIAIIVIAVFSLSKTTEAYRGFVRKGDIVATEQKTQFVSNLINEVVRDNESYWLGPWDFQSQILVRKDNASSYRFYLPWHMVCDRCNADLIRDFTKNQPTVVYLDKEWFKYWTDYGKIDPKSTPLYNYITSHYVTHADVRLEGFYFLESKNAELTGRLKEQGY